MKKLLPILLVFIGLFAFLAVPTLALSTNPDFSQSAEQFISKNCDKVSGNSLINALCFLLVGSQNKSLYVYDGKGIKLGPLVTYDVANLNISVYSTLLNLVVNINPNTGALESKTGWIYYLESECAGTPYVSVKYSNELFVDANGMLYSPSPSNNDFRNQIIYRSLRGSLASSCEPNENLGGTDTNNVIPLRQIIGDGEEIKAFENIALPLSIKFE